ncbi:uncharacterized protein F5891DRAFT_594384 [Suillus fuscotomentosus]|uniref:Uncharacterized protein n=1 Tax=Suillus fuscotomentosus TaxID=1912939 RepID=A0AAD4DYI4_9AGAM|nr:uncharacterized protein F5891DRAFT_594384 [Suillus fuscotomentosus]KAG1896466.1 hypothetical protein F5891DRAFT_594384 [Suillus fuscotomentosus]
MNIGERFRAAARSLMLLCTTFRSLSLFDSQADEVAGRKASVHEALSAISEVQLRALFNFHECHDDQIHHSASACKLQGLCVQLQERRTHDGWKLLQNLVRGVVHIVHTATMNDQ